MSKKQKALVSVLIPVYNGSKFIKDAIDSILNQTYQRFEIIIYDDGSTDRTLKQIPKHPKIRVIHSGVNRGNYYARNRLIESARTPYCCWQDADDLSHPERLKLQHAELIAQDADIVFSYLKFFRNGQSYKRRGSVYTIDISKYKDPSGLNGSNMCFATSFFRTGVGKRVKFDESNRSGGGDLDWLRRLMFKEQSAKPGLVTQALYYCRRHEDRMTFRRRVARLRKAGKDPAKDPWIKSNRSIGQ